MTAAPYISSTWREAAATRAAQSVPTSCHVYTPADLAAAVVKAIGDSLGASWLEPCIGDGAFLRALHAAGVTKNRVRGFDLVDLSSPNDHFGVVSRSTEFLAWSRRSTNTFDRIVANPPYARLVRCSKAIRNEARMLGRETAFAIPGSSNLWYAFLVASIQRLNVGARIGFILPASFEYANYCAILRERLPSLFSRVVVLRSSKSLFDEPPVEGGAIVLLGYGFGEKPAEKDAVTMTYRRVEGTGQMIEALSSLSTSRQFAIAKPVGRSSAVASSVINGTKSSLGTVAEIRIGAVTGDSNFFLLSDERRRALHLPTASCLRVVSKRRHLHIAGGLVDGVTWSRLREIGERVWLFRPPEKVVENRHIAAYMKRTPEEGGCRRSAFKVANREKWFVVPVPRKVHALISPSMGTVPSVALVTGSVNATNALYTVRFLKRLTINQQAGVLLSLFLPEAIDCIERSIRHYIGGLKKLEPGDLSPVKVIVRHDAADGALDCLKEVMRLVSLGHEGPAASMAQRWFSGSTT